MTDLDASSAESIMQAPAARLSADPLIIASSADVIVSNRDGTTRSLLLGLTEILGQRCRHRPFISLLKLMWSFETGGKVARLARAIRDHIPLFPLHRVVILCNTPQELGLFQSAGIESLLANHNIFCSEASFHPLPDVPVEYDAVYNARPVPIKRHDLAQEIDRVIYLGYLNVVSPEARTIVQSIVAKQPKHVIANEIVDGLPKRVDRPEVNRTLSRAAVGWCLSEVEGAMLASMEYLLAGLPVVSTPSKGGRDLFFDSDYCLIAEPTPQAVREAVETLRDRNIPRATFVHAPWPNSNRSGNASPHFWNRLGSNMARPEPTSWSGLILETS